MNREAIIVKLKSILLSIKSSSYNISEHELTFLSKGEDLISTIQLDSLDIINLTIALNEEFDINFGTSKEDIKSLKNLNTLSENIYNKIQIKG